MFFILGTSRSATAATPRAPISLTRPCLVRNPKEQSARVGWGLGGFTPGFALALLIAGCLPAPTAEHRPAACATPAGFYSETFTERSGTCGALPDQILVVDVGTLDAATQCTGTQYELAGCAMTMDNVCPAAPGYVLSTRGRVDFKSDGRTGTGSLQLRWFSSDGKSIVCSSTYDVALSQRQKEAMDTYPAQVP